MPRPIGRRGSAAATTRYALEIPKGLSLLAFHDPNAEVRGLRSVERTLWPPVVPVHLGFQVMVALGTYLALAGAWVLTVMLWFAGLTVNEFVPPLLL